MKPGTAGSNPASRPHITYLELDMPEHRCNQCKTGKGDTCTLTGATHTTGIECPSFGQKENEMFKVGDEVRVIAGTMQGNAGVITFVQGGTHRVDIGGGNFGIPPSNLELVEEDTVEAAPIDFDHIEQAPIRTFESGAKDTNPKDALGVKKAPLSTLPTGPIYEVALAMLEGARKYGRHNYRVMGVKASVYYDAAMGHLTAWWEGEDVDPTSGLHHLAKAMACLAVVRDSEMMGNWVDDRPPRYPDASKLMRNHPAVGGILKRYPECKRPFTWHTTNRTAPTGGKATCGQY